MPGLVPPEAGWIEAVPGGALCLRGDGIITAANRAAIALFATTDETVRGRDLRELCRADSRARIDALLADPPLPGAEPVEDGAWVLRGDRRSLSVLLRVAALGRDANGMPILLIGMQPRAPHQQLDDAFGNVEARFRRFLDIVDVWIFGLAPGLHALLHSNRCYGDIWGGTLTELQADPASLLDYVEAPDLDRARALFGVGTPAAPGESDLRIRHPGKGARIVRVRVFVVAHDDGTQWLYGTAEDVTQVRALERERIEHAIRQRDVLVREVHHRIKNNLQGVAGLLRQGAARRPEIAGTIDEVAGQIHAIAQVHGLQVGADGQLALQEVARAVFDSLGRNFGLAIAFDEAEVQEDAPRWLLAEQDAVPLALVINELGTNAIKHRRAAPPRDGVRPGADPGAGDGAEDGAGFGAEDAAPVAARFGSDARGAWLEVSNPGALTAGFAFDRLVPAPSGLGLIKSLLPRRGARLAFSEARGRVCARLELNPPAIGRGDGSRNAPAGA